MSFIKVYASRTSVRPGEDIDFHINNRPGARGPIVPLRIQRIERPNENQAAVDLVLPNEADETGDSVERGCAWPVAHSLRVPLAWPSGWYRVAVNNSAFAMNDPRTFFTDGDPNVAYVDFVVRPRVRSSPILLQLPVATANAYNAYGGKSLYSGPRGYADRARAVSFLRPTPLSYDKDKPLTDLSNAVVGFETGQGGSRPLSHFVQWLEAWGKAKQQGIDYCTSVDLHGDPGILAGYSLLLLAGHDEYWSLEMRRRLDDFVTGGGNVAVFAGNVCWWQVRFADDLTSFECYKSAVEDPVADRARTTVEWYSEPVCDPENRMTGTSFRNGSYAATGHYVVTDADHSLLRGTNLGNGQEFGGPALLGYEADGALFNEVVDSAGSHPRALGRDGTPGDLTILARGQMTPGGWGVTGSPTMCVYSRTGTVFHAGTVDWGAALGGDPQVTRITENVLEQLGLAVRPFWEVVGPTTAIDVLVAWDGKLLAGLAQDFLGEREPALQYLGWRATMIPKLADVVAMGSCRGRLYAVDTNGLIYQADAGVWENVDKLSMLKRPRFFFAATSQYWIALTDDGTIWRRDPNSPGWTSAGTLTVPFDEIVAMCADAEHDELFFAMHDGRLMWALPVGATAPTGATVLSPDSSPSDARAMAVTGGRIFLMSESQGLLCHRLA